MKKLLVLFIILLSFLLVIAGCANDTDSEDGNDSNVEEDIIEDENDPDVEPEPDLDNEETSDNNDDSDIDSILSKSQGVDEYYYEYESESEGEVATMKMWNSGNKTRTEMNLEEEESIIVISDEDEKEQYIYYPNQNMAIKSSIERELEEDKGKLLKDYMYDLDVENMTIIGDENYEGQKVKVVEYKVDNFNSRLWLSKENGFPLKAETYEDGNLINKMRVIDFKEGPFKDSLFEIPKDVEIQDLTNMGNQ
ncbi:hypothetical protein [Senegalia sp. (in: firmicutes)]|uniref:hypothetical protein n=1 Tax=Senegalia sp. (in: firmicutes) TaxID=1924098 RepID=UPI003F991825